MPSEKQMRCVKRESISEAFEVHDNDPVPPVCSGGARVKVWYAGACYTDGQVAKSGQRRPRMPGVLDTSLFPGFEVSGVVDEVSIVDTNNDLKVGDRVIVYPDNDEQLIEAGYAEYVTVKDAINLVPVPDSLPLDLAAILPCGALTAYAAVQRVRPFVQEKLKSSTAGIVNILIVGAGGLALWTLKLAEFYLGSNCTRVRLTVADSNVDKLEIAKQHGCYDVIHWNEALHEEYILMRINNVCKGGVDVVIDFVSSARTISRATSVLKQDGVLLVGGNSKYDVSIDLHTLAMKGQSILGINHGTRDQLVDLVQLVSNGQVKPPVFSVFPVDQATRVFEQLSQCRIDGRAVLRVCDDDDDSVFLPSASSSSVGRGWNSPEPFTPGSEPSPGVNDVKPTFTLH